MTELKVSLVPGLDLRARIESVADADGQGRAKHSRKLVFSLFDEEQKIGVRIDATEVQALLALHAHKDDPSNP